MKSRLLEHGDRIRLGPDQFRFVLADEEPQQVSSVILRGSPLLETGTMVHLRPQDSAYLRVDAVPEIGPDHRHLKALLRLSGLVRAREGLDALVRGILEVVFDTIPAMEGALLLIEPGAGLREH